MFSLEQYNALRQQAGVVDRSGRGRLLLKGRDRRSYLQGLLTNDVEALTAGSGCYSAFLTPQGRMLADMRVLETGREVMIDLPRSVADAIRDRLSQFIFSEDVEVVDISASHAQVGLYGPAAPRLLSRLIDGDDSVAESFEMMPLYANVERAVAGAGARIVRSDDIGVLGFDLFLDAAAKGELYNRFREAGGVDVAAEAAEVCRIEAGRPLFSVDMDHDTIPLEAGIEDRAISFTKGCYVGQEIVIRVLHRGHGRVARKLVGMTLEPAGGVPAHGTTIRAGDRDIGSITSAVTSPALGCPIALGYVHRDFAERGTEVTVGTVQGQVVTLPFVPIA